MNETATTSAAPTVRTVLNAGSGPRHPRRLFVSFLSDDWKEVTLDIDPQAQPDQVGSVTDMRDFFADDSFDAIWSSHNIEHLHAHEVLPTLREFVRVLKRDGFALITCPDLESVAKLIATHGLDYIAYDSPAGPIMVRDMVFGHGASIAAGNVFMAHNTGFTSERLGGVALEAGFAEAYVGKGDCFDLWAVLLMPEVDKAALTALLRPTNVSFLLPPERS